eukprot:428305-Amphidinium_carterae.1
MKPADTHYVARWVGMSMVRVVSGCGCKLYWYTENGTSIPPEDIQIEEELSALLDRAHFYETVRFSEQSVVLMLQPNHASGPPKPLKR